MSKVLHIWVTPPSSSHTGAEGWFGGSACLGHLLLGCTVHTVLLLPDPSPLRLLCVLLFLRAAMGSRLSALGPQDPACLLARVPLCSQLLSLFLFFVQLADGCMEGGVFCRVNQGKPPRPPPSRHLGQISSSGSCQRPPPQILKNPPEAKQGSPCSCNLTFSEFWDSCPQITPGHSCESSHPTHTHSQIPNRAIIGIGAPTELSTHQNKGLRVPGGNPPLGSP